MMLEGAGFQIVDPAVDVPAHRFDQAVRVARKVLNLDGNPA